MYGWRYNSIILAHIKQHVVVFAFVIYKTSITSGLVHELIQFQGS
jgi:hypothetical protein